MLTSAVSKRGATVVLVVEDEVVELVEDVEDVEDELVGDELVVVGFVVDVELLVDELEVDELELVEDDEELVVVSFFLSLSLLPSASLASVVEVVLEVELVDVVLELVDVELVLEEVAAAAVAFKVVVVAPGTVVVVVVGSPSLAARTRMRLCWSVSSALETSDTRSRWLPDVAKVTVNSCSPASPEVNV